jgi:hypothetical protein
LPGIDSEEVILGNVTFENGAIGVIGDSVCCIRDHYTQLIGTKGSVIMSGEHDETVLRFHREGQQDEELIPARDSKRPGGGSIIFWNVSGKVNSLRIRFAVPGTR